MEVKKLTHDWRKVRNFATFCVPRAVVCLLNVKDPFFFFFFFFHGAGLKRLKEKKALKVSGQAFTFSRSYNQLNIVLISSQISYSRGKHSC